jgi:cell shape-determining protein MreC
MSSGLTFSAKLIAAFCCCAAIMLGFVPPNVAHWWRSAVRDGFRPGVQLAADAHQATARAIRQRLLGDDAKILIEQLETTRSELSETQRQLRRERLAHQQTRDTNLLALQRHDETHRPIDPPPLIVPQVVQARVLGEELASAWRRGLLLNQGRNNGLTEEALVINSSAELLDQGEDAGLSPDMAVFAGLCVLGKLQHVGRWSSTWVPLTDLRFRGRARLARVTSDGLVFRAEGVLIGRGEDGCRLTLIRATEPVSEGDEVFALESPGGFETPLYYGTVVRSELAPGATHWEIEVRPAVDARSVRDVSVVRPRVNSKRLAN